MWPTTDDGAVLVRDRACMAVVDKPELAGASPVPQVAPLLECHGICKRFGAVEALIDVDFEVYAGEVVALVGDNGAGKSTLIKAISGTQPADSGTFVFDGREVSIRNPADANKLGIETVYQDLALCDNLDAVANLYLGRESAGPRWLPGPLRVLYEPAMEEHAGDRMRSLRVTTIESLRERVGQTAQVLDLIRRLRAQGLGVVVITHNIDVVFEVAERIVVLYMGRRSATFDQRSTSPRDVVSAIVGLSATPS